MVNVRKISSVPSKVYHRLSYTQKEEYVKSLFHAVCDDESQVYEVNEGEEQEDDVAAAEFSADKNANENAEFDDEEDNNEDDSNDNDDEEATLPINLNVTQYVARDGTVWDSEPRQMRQTRRQNVLRQKSGPINTTKTMSIISTFKCFISVEMADIICRQTNKKAAALFALDNEQHPERSAKIWKPVTVAEIYVLIGILIQTGANRSSGESVADLWAIDSKPLYRAAMGVNRFTCLLRYLRFDNFNSRTIHMEADKAAPISELWEMMNYNLNHYYKPSENLTVDEQLFPYRGRTRFTQYIPSKPAKYGIKVWWICDAKNAYPLQGQIYTGQAATGRETRQGECVVKDLVGKFQGNGRNITMDNFFTTLDLAENLLSKNLTLVGTVRKNKTFIPNEMKAHKDRAVGSTLFGFMPNAAICSYVPKKNKAVVLLSTMHDDVSITETGKPEIIDFYNQTKGGVNVMDQLLGEYTCQRQTRRWLLSLFFNMIDLTALAAYIIYYENNGSIPYTNMR